MSALKSLAVWATEEADSEALKLSKRLGVPLFVQEEPPTTVKWVFFYEEDKLHLWDLTQDFNPFAVDYLAGEFVRRWKGATRNDLLYKAIGLKKGVRTVLDATGGLGYDALFLHLEGTLNITFCERNPIVWELANDALLRVKEAGVLEDRPVQFYFGDARELMADYEFDAIYLDPLFPRTEEKTAKQKKEMQILRDLSDGGDMDAEELFQAALKKAKNRVVVKRPDDGTFITEARKPDFTIEGKSVRFDVYLKI